MEKEDGGGGRVSLIESRLDRRTEMRFQTRALITKISFAAATTSWLRGVRSRGESQRSSLVYYLHV